MRFYAEIKGHRIDTRALWAIIGRDEINLTEVEDGVFLYGEISPYALGWVLDRASWFGKVELTVEHNPLPKYQPDSSK